MPPAATYSTEMTARSSAIWAHSCTMKCRRRYRASMANMPALTIEARQVLAYRAGVPCAPSLPKRRYSSSTSAMTMRVKVRVCRERQKEAREPEESWCQRSILLRRQPDVGRAAVIEAVGAHRFRGGEVQAAVGAGGHGLGRFDGSPGRRGRPCPGLARKMVTLGAQARFTDLGADGKHHQHAQRQPEQQAAHATARCSTTSSTKREPT